ncbi:MAG TPA: class I SAM-dependent RNA methyltransferase [Spirochaetia bacterium]|nr:class I SAM-dependent RNA methyltransferase [Spirochaetia bacterium]
MNTASHAVALCALGLEKVLQSEIERIGLKPAGREAGRVRFELGAKPDAELMRANLCLRTAERILIEAGRFHAENFDELFEQVRNLPWELYFRRDDRLLIERVRLRDSKLAAQTSVQSIAHKAIYERLGGVFNLRRLPESGAARSMRIYIEADQCLLGLDSSGEALHKRGYRRATSEAPLKETVAAGLLFLSGWNRRIPLLDPFCGSGTILVEAALYAMDRAPGLGRAFALEGMPFAGAAALGAEIEAAKARVRRDAEFRILGSDLDPRALEAARANAALAGVAAGLELRKAKAEEATPTYERGYLLANPPYGERLGSIPEAEALYGRLGEAAERFSGWGLGFIVNRPDFGDFFGFQAPKQHKIVNGAEEQWFSWFPPGYSFAADEREVGQGGASRGPVEPSPRAKRPGAPRASRGERSPGGARGSAGSRTPRRPWIGPDLPGWKAPRRGEGPEPGARRGPPRPARPLGPDRSGWKKRQG